MSVPISTHPIPDDGIPRFLFGSLELSRFHSEERNMGMFTESVYYYVIHHSLSGGPTLVVKSLGEYGQRVPRVLEEFYLPRRTS